MTMRLRWAVALIALLPLALATLAATWVVTQRSQVLADLHLAAVEPVLLASRRSELQSYVNLARSAIAHVVRDGMPSAQAQEQALAILRRLEFSHDGYFFVFDFEGNALLYPRQPQLQGQNLLHLQDRQGQHPIQKLLAQARAGGGYVQYEWARPSTGRMETKLGYVEPIAGWEWMIGTGTYIDEPEVARRRMSEATTQAVSDTLWRIGTIAVLATVGVVAAALMLNLNEQRKADSKLRAMAGQIVLSQEAERARVARELHDGVSQWLVSVKYVFESALERSRQKPNADEKLTQQLDEGVERLREVLGEVRRISHDLRPALLDDLGLQGAIAHLASTWEQRSGVPVTLHNEVHDTLPEAVSTALFRVAQEALGNVESHAQAKAVQLRLTRGINVQVLEVQDDGRGFNADALMHGPRAGLGLSNMRERIESLGGQFRISSTAVGTLLHAALPLS
jgi:two-component system, NarL family, sensor kinase